MAKTINLNELIDQRVKAQLAEFVAQLVSLREKLKKLPAHQPRVSKAQKGR